jgi:hypothetical protein
MAPGCRFQLKSGRTSAPRLPHALQMNRSSTSDSLTDKLRLYVEEPDVIRPAIAVDGD